MSSATSTFGANIAFIEELYEKYRSDPDSVSPSWREFFHDYQPQLDEESGGQPPPAVPPPPPSRTAEAAVLHAVPSPVLNAVPLRGAAGKIAQNMEASLAVPTATSVRTIPVKALEENRRVINNHLTLNGQTKASFTHIVAWAIVKAVKNHPRMNSAFVEQDGQPARIDREDVNFGIAIDVERKDGSRSLVVPNIKRAQTMDFAQFLKAYNDIVRKARNNTLEVADFEGTSISLTNPGTIGTIASVPRLMPTQGAIIATGQIDYPPEYSATDATVSCRSA